MACSSFSDRRRVASLAAAAVLVLGLVVPLTAARAAISNDELVNFFSDIVFGTNTKNSAPGTLYVKKWTEPLRIAITAFHGDLIKHDNGTREMRMKAIRPSDAHLKAIQTHLRTLVKLTGVKTEDARKTQKPVNIAIKLVPRLAMAAPFLEKDVNPKLLRELAHSGRCYFLSWASKTGSIVRALIVVNNELPDNAFSACMLRDLTQMLGLAGESDRIKPSVFNIGAERQDLAPVDRVLLQGLYDKRIAPGSHPDEAKAAAAKVLPELARGKL